MNFVQSFLGDKFNVLSKQQIELYILAIALAMLRSQQFMLGLHFVV